MDPAAPVDTIVWAQPTSSATTVTTTAENPKNWVRFDDDEDVQEKGEFVTIPFDRDEPAIFPTTVQMVNDSVEAEKETITTPTPTNANENEEKKFKNGEIIVNIYPLNDSCDWVTPPKFKAHLVPEELMAKCLTMTVEDYVNNMRMLVNDYRFKCYTIFYKRIVALWAALSVSILLGILFSGWLGAKLFIAAMSWLLGNCLALGVVIYAKKQMIAGLAECIGQVNEQFFKHNILIGVDDAGNYSCHKVNIVFIYFEPKTCVEYLRNNLSDRLKDIPKEATNMFSVVRMTWDNTVHSIDTADIIITGPSNSKTIPQKEKYYEKLLLQYAQPWAKCIARNSRLEPKNEPTSEPQPQSQQQQQDNPVESNRNDRNTKTLKATGGDAVHHQGSPRHCVKCKCLCQFIEDIFVVKQRV